MARSWRSFVGNFEVVQNLLRLRPGSRTGTTPKGDRMQHPVHPDYEIIEQLDSTVYKARFLRLNNRLVILKYQGKSGPRPMLEARLMAGLRHPNIAALHAIGEFEGWVVLTMEYFAGVALSDLIEEELSSDQVARIESQLQDVEDFVKGIGVSHRRPLREHALVDEDDNIKITAGAWRDASLRRDLFDRLTRLPS